ncbi:ABC transporter substrate-binding protein, partial [Thermodesulfobacteriota bacterium]
FSWGIVSAAQKPMTVAELALYQGTDRQQILEEGAKKEGKLTLYTMGILKQAVRPNVAAFEKKYPFIKVKIFRTSSNNLIPRVVEEFRMGKSFADVIEGNQMTDLVFLNARILQSYYSPNLAVIEKSAVKQASDGGSLSTGFRGSSISLGYNTNMIKEIELPKTYEDLLDPKWKGKMVLAGYSGANWLGVILDNLGEDFAKRLSGQNFDTHMISARAILDLIISGEYALSTTIYDSHVFKSKDKGAPVDWFPIEPVFGNLGRIAMPKLTSHPHSALLLIDYYLSKKSAEIHKTAGYSSTRLDTPGRASYKRYFGPKTLADVKKWKNAFSRLFITN